MYMKKYPCVFMRGGTSKGIFFHEKDLPQDKTLWDEIFLKVMGTPDVKQIDGMGGTVSSTSKVAVISPSNREGVDVDYNFFQIEIDVPIVDNLSNCGNLIAAVGPFAIDEGLVEAVEPITVVRIYNTNTKKIIEQHIRVKDGRAMVHGDEEIKGVPGIGSRIDMYFENPAGSKTGKLFPTGNKIDTLDIPGHGPIEITFIDCANPVVCVRAEDIGMKGTELVELNNNKDILEHIERIRGMAAVKVGFVEKWEDAKTKSTSIPKVAIISKPQDYVDMDGNEAKAEKMDMCVRAISVGKLHKACPMTVAVAIGSACRIEGTLVNSVIKPEKGQEIIAFGHASGITEVDVKLNGEEVLKGGVTRTARRIMDGYVYVRD